MRCHLRGHFKVIEPTFHVSLSNNIARDQSSENGSSIFQNFLSHKTVKPHNLTFPLGNREKQAPDSDNLCLA